MTAAASIGSQLAGSVVLVTGGTRGIGLETGAAFGRRGARCVLTHRWGSASEEEIRARFASEGAPEPMIEEADVGNAKDTTALLERVRERLGAVDVYVANAAMAPPVNSLDDYVKRDFMRAIEYTAWPMAEYAREMKRLMGRYPRYVVGLSSPGHLRYVRGYDAVALAKSVLETMCRYLAYRLAPEGTTVNVVRAGFVDTSALAAVTGEEVVERLRAEVPEYIVPARQVADAVLALCSGLLDGVTGHVLDVDRGAAFSDSIMRHLERRLEPTPGAGRE